MNIKDKLRPAAVLTALALWPALMTCSIAVVAGEQTTQEAPLRASKQPSTLVLTPVRSQLLVTPLRSAPKRVQVGTRTKVQLETPNRRVKTPESSGDSVGVGGTLGWLINKESGGNPNASNGKYFGVGQLSPDARRAQAAKLGVDPNTRDKDQQIKMMQGYIADRYGSVERAAAHHRARGWY